MDQSQSSVELPFDERWKQKPQQAPLKVPHSVEESSQMTETTASATISTFPSLSESKVMQRQRYVKNHLLEVPNSDSKLAGLRKEWESINSRRLFDSNSEGGIAEDEGGDAVASNDTRSAVSLPQEQMNELKLASSGDSTAELTAETEHLRYLREKVDRQVQSMSKLLKGSPQSDRAQGPEPGESSSLSLSLTPQRHKQAGTRDAALQQFHALSKQVFADFMDNSKESPIVQRRRKRESAPAIHSLQSSEVLRLELKEARYEIEELQRQLTDQELSLSLGDAGPKVVLLQEQRSKLQKRIRELLQDAAELRQERNAYEKECVEQSRKIDSLEASLQQLEAEKKDSEKGLYRYISALQDKSTQLLEELQETRGMLQHESQSRIEASMEAKHRIAALESEKKRLQRVIARNAAEPGLIRSNDHADIEEDHSVIPDQPIISNMEAIAGNDRIEKMRSEVQQRRAKIEAIRRNRSDENKSSPPNRGNQTPSYRNRAASPISLNAFSPPRSGDRSTRSPMSFVPDHPDGPPGLQLFLQRIEAAMEEGASSFANQNAAFYLQQELLDLKHENLQLKLEVEEADDNAAVLESTARGTVARLQEAANREEKLTKEVKEHRASATAAKAELEKREIELNEKRQELEGLKKQLSETQQECLALKERAKQFGGWGQDIIESHKTQNRAMASQIDSLEMTLVDLEMTNSSLEDVVGGLQGDLKQQEGLVAKLSADLSASSGRESSTRKELETERNALQSKIADLSLQLTESQKKKDALEQSVKQLESTVSSAEEKQVEIATKLAASEAELTKSKLEAVKLTNELEALQEAMEKLSTEKAAQAMALKHADQVQSELASRLAAAELALKEQGEIALLQDEEVSELVEKCLGIKSDASTLTADDGSPSKPQSLVREALESKLALDFPETSERRGVLERQLRDLHSQFQSLRQGGDSNERRTAGLGRNPNFQSLDSAIGRLRAECDELASKNARLQDQNDEMKQLVSDSETLRKELERVVSEREREVASLRDASIAMEAKSTALQTHQDKLASENQLYASIQEELQTRLADASRLIDSSLPRIKDLEAKVEELKNDIKGRDIVLNEMGKENTKLTDKVQSLNNAIEYWVKKCTDLESAGSATRKDGDSDDLVTKVTEHIQRLSSAKEDVMEQLFRTAGAVDYKSPKKNKVSKEANDLLTDIQDLHYVLDTVREFVVASREATKKLDRTIESLRDEKSLLNTRNAALERIVEEQRTQSNEFEKLLSTMRVVPDHGSVASHAVQSRGTQTEWQEDLATDGGDQGTNRSMSPISEINTNDDLSNPSWADLSEVDSKNDSLKHFPPCDDISDLSQSIRGTAFLSQDWEENTSYSISIQPPSTQLESITAAESFQQLQTPRVSNSAHPQRINRQQQPPEYNITLGALSPPPPTTKITTYNTAQEEASPMDRYSIEEEQEDAEEEESSENNQENPKPYYF